MNKERKVSNTLYVVAIIATFLIMAFLVRAMSSITRTAPVGGNRAAERTKNLHELRNLNAQALTTHDWVDKGKGLVRLPIDEAMKITVQEYQAPEKGRSNLLARLAKATAAPPKPPEKPNPYE